MFLDSASDRLAVGRLMVECYEIGQPVDRSSACDWRISSFNSLSLISASWDGLLRRIVIFSVTTEVSSPSMSLTDTSGLSEMASSERDFQFLIEMEPARWWK
uniref:Uncharacterized protein n=1 Tax=Anopheles melas TaxID=34690 RepID=A0A182U566_9DIPT